MANLLSEWTSAATVVEERRAWIATIASASDGLTECLGRVDGLAGLAWDLEPWVTYA